MKKGQTKSSTKHYECTNPQCSKTEYLPHWAMKQRKQPFMCLDCSKKRRMVSNAKQKLENPKDWERRKKAFSERLKIMHSQMTKEERIEAAKYRNSCIITDRSIVRAKQQQTIESDPEKYQKYCEKRKQIAFNFHANMTDTDKEEHYRKVFKNRGRSKECDDFMVVLADNNIICDQEVYIKGFFVDGLIEQTNIVVEYYGDMFHCHPTKFNDPEQVCSWLGGRTVQQQWDRDKMRLAALYRYGYKVVIVWGSEWKKNQAKVLERIKNEMC